jgi:hypothetical protein
MKNNEEQEEEEKKTYTFCIFCWLVFDYLFIFISMNELKLYIN